MAAGFHRDVVDPCFLQAAKGTVQGNSIGAGQLGHRYQVFWVNAQGADAGSIFTAGLPDLT